MPRRPSRRDRSRSRSAGPAPATGAATVTATSPAASAAAEDEWLDLRETPGAGYGIDCELLYRKAFGFRALGF